MLADRLTWLSRTVEQALDADLRICDPHHHLWEYPQHRYLVDEFLTDLAGGHRIERSVYVECHQKYHQDGPETLRPVGETLFVHQSTAALQQQTAQCRIAAGIVGFADLTLGAAVEEVLAAHSAASDRFRGIRYCSAWDADERIRPAHTHPPPGLLGEKVFREGLARLRDHELSFDAWLYHHQIPELIDLARAFPDITIVLNHAGGPLGIGPYAGRREEVFALWRRHMIELARSQNVFVKFGGLTMKMSGFGWHELEKPPGSADIAAALAPYFDVCMEHFGPGRCMFESNWPMDQASCSYTVLWNAYKRLARGLSPSQRARLLDGTAAQVYRLDD